MFRVPISGGFYGKHISQALFATDRVLKLNTFVMISLQIQIGVVQNVVNRYDECRLYIEYKTRDICEIRNQYFILSFINLLAMLF